MLRNNSSISTNFILDLYDSVNLDTYKIMKALNWQEDEFVSMIRNNMEPYKNKLIVMPESSKSFLREVVLKDFSTMVVKKNSLSTLYNKIKFDYAIQTSQRKSILKKLEQDTIRINDYKNTQRSVVCKHLFQIPNIPEETDFIIFDDAVFTGSTLNHIATSLGKTEVFAVFAYANKEE